MYNLHVYTKTAIFPEYPENTYSTEHKDTLLKELRDLFDNKQSGISRILIENDEFGLDNTLTDSQSPMKLDEESKDKFYYDNELTDQFLIDNGFNHRSDDTYMLSISDAPMYSHKEQNVYLEKWEENYPDGCPWWVIIRNDLTGTQMKTYVGTISALKDILRVCGFSTVADNLKIN